LKFVPLFETIDDLKQAGAVMESLYENSIYREHLRKLNNKQTIMLGFRMVPRMVDLMANWVFIKQEVLTAISANTM
jgi:phosphoenolpyruvate carboxylase